MSNLEEVGVDFCSRLKGREELPEQRDLSPAGECLALSPGRGRTAAGAFISRRGRGEGVALLDVRSGGDNTQEI